MCNPYPGITGVSSSPLVLRPVTSISTGQASYEYQFRSNPANFYTS